MAVEKSTADMEAEVQKIGTIWNDEDGNWYVDAPKLGEGDTR